MRLAIIEINFHASLDKPFATPSFGLLNKCSHFGLSFPDDDFALWLEKSNIYAIDWRLLNENYVWNRWQEGGGGDFFCNRTTTTVANVCSKRKKFFTPPKSATFLWFIPSPVRKVFRLSTRRVMRRHQLTVLLLTRLPPLTLRDIFPS